MKREETSSDPHVFAVNSIPSWSRTDGLVAALYLVQASENNENELYQPCGINLRERYDSKWADHVLLISCFNMEIFYLSFTAENSAHAGENIVKAYSNFHSYPNFEVI